MKTFITTWLLAVLLSVTFTTHIIAQTTAFTYQGRLNDGGNAASGIYDLRFAIYDAVTNGAAQAGPLTNAPTSVSNGLFTVTLDFGAGAFTGADRWLDIGVRTNGSADDYQALSPRQPLTATPYATRAANFSGAVSDSQLSTNVARLDGNQTFGGTVNFSSGSNTFTGSFAGNGAGLTHVPGALPTQMITDTSVQAQPNTAYIANSAAQVLVSLPTNADTGSVVRVYGLGAGGWRVEAGAGQYLNGYQAGITWVARETNRSWHGVASSADGTKLVAVDNNPGQIYTSTDSGTNWIARETNRAWWWVASSADGSKLVAVHYMGQIYTSTDNGTNWIARESNRGWRSVASSADGSKLVAVGNGAQIYTSTDSGTNWVARESSRTWWSVASSADGTKLAAVVALGGQIYTSTDSGTNWTARESNRDWRGIASSADGSKLLAADNGGSLYTSTDGGTNWVARESARNWYSANAMSADGAKQFAGVLGGQLYASLDSGTNWLARESSRQWRAIAASADGNKLVAVVAGGQIFTSTTLPLVGVQGSMVELQYAGGGVWQPLNNGSILTDLNATNVATGKLADARLSTNVALRAGGNYFSGTQVITNGNVGIGTTNPPAFTLEVNGSAGKPGGGSWSTSSDARLKKNIHPLASALDKLLALHGVNFEYVDPATIHELSGERMGLIAQEVEQVFPDWVETGPNGYKRVTVRGLEALVVEALRQLRQEQDGAKKERDAEIRELTKSMTELKTQVSRLAGEKKSDAP